MIDHVTKAYPTSLTEAALVVGALLIGQGAGAGSRFRRSNVAVDDVSLRFEEGERVGIIGRNGAGKSTLVHMIAGLAEPSSGTVRVEGQVTAVMTLGVGLKEELSGRENIYLDGELQGKRHNEIDAVMKEIVAFADLGDFIDLPVRTYSTGMKARLAFAMITCIEPEILIIDEALSVGDADFARKASQKIKDVCGKGKIVLVVSHSMEGIVDICSRCIWMERGRIVMDGDPRHVTRQYSESIRAEDETQLAETFKAHAGTWSRNGLVAVSRPEFFQGVGRDPRLILESGVDTVIRTRVRLDKQIDQPQARLTIERLDGLMVCDERLVLSQVAARPPTGDLEVEALMRPLLLGPGVFGVVFSLEDGNGTVATGSGVVEIFARDLPTGGRPALLYPHRIEMIPALIRGEERCP